MPDTIGAEIDLDLGNFERSINDAIGQASEFDDALQSMIDTANQDIEVNVSMSSDPLPFDDIPESIDTEITTSEDEQTQNTFSILDAIKTGTGFTAVIAVAGAIVDVLDRLENLTIEPFLDIDDASARVAAQTGLAHDNVAGMIAEIHQADLGTSYDQIADTITQASQLGVTGTQAIQDAATAALMFTKIFTDQNPNEVLRTMDQMVTQGLVPDFQTASDLLVVAFQNGDNAGGDLLTTITRYGPLFKQLGISGDQMFSILNSGMDNGYRNATDLARQFQTFFGLVTSQGGDPNSDFNQALSQIGVNLPAAGEPLGAEFIQSVIDGINANPDGPMSQDELVRTIFGQQAAASGNILGVNVADAAFSDFEGAAATAATEMDNSFRGALDDLGLAIETMVQNFLSSKQIDLPGKINAIKEGLQRALAEVAAGASLGEALEVGLQIPGLNDTFMRIEMAFGNFEITLLQVVASLADLIGQHGAAQGARQEVTRLAGGQLTFDLQVADNGAAIQESIRTAIERGVSVADVSTAVQTAMDEAIQSGHLDVAQTIAEGIHSMGAVDASGMFDPGTMIEQAQVAVQAANDAWTAAMQSGDFDAAGQIAEQLDDPALYEQTFQQAFLHANLGVADAMARDLNDPTLITQVEDTANVMRDQFETAFASGDVETATWLADALGDEELITRAQEMNTQVSTEVDTMATSVETAGTRVHDTISGHSMTTDFQALADSANQHIPAVVLEFQNLAAESADIDIATEHVGYLTAAIEGLGNTIPVLLSVIENLQQIAQVGSTAAGVIGSLPNVPTPPPGGGTVNTSNVTVNQNNNVQTTAAGVMLGYQTARMIRGF